ncbi:MAG TPA: hypothetical protein VIU37_09840 [Candidatus Limnocylindrales bacterium]
MINSTSRVDLVYPTGDPAMLDGGATLAEVESAFREWLAEAKRRGCPEGAKVHVGPHDSMRPGFAPHLSVYWEAPTEIEENRRSVCICPDDGCSPVSCPVCTPSQCIRHGGSAERGVGRSR